MPELKPPKSTKDELTARARHRAKLAAIKIHCDICNCEFRSDALKEHNMSNKHRVNQGFPPYRKRY